VENLGLDVPDRSAHGAARGRDSISRHSTFLPRAGRAMNALAQNLIDALSLGSLFALIAVGVTILYAVMGLMNFAQGEFIMVPAYVLYLLAGAPFLLALAAALASGVIVAVAAERIAFRPVRGADLSAQLVTSLAVAVVLQNIVVATIETRPQSVATPRFFGGSVTIAGLRVENLDLVTIGATLTALVSLGVLLRRTRLGLNIRAAAENLEMARLLGVRANRVIPVCFALSGILAALVGVILTAQSGQVSPSMGLAPVLIGFIAVSIGGLGRLSGAVMGGLVLGALSSLLGAYLPSGLVPFRDAIVFSVPILLLILRPHGLIAGELGKARV
jgi:branched-chain amino acid transport system permease protein